MNRKVIKIIIICIVSILLLATQSFADPFGLGDLNQYGGDSQTSTELSTMSQQITSVISTIGIVVSVVVLMVMGIKFMMGSLEEKAEYKKAFIPYIIGAVLVFGISAILNIILGIANQI